MSSWFARVGALRPRLAVGLLLAIGAFVHGQSLLVGLVADDFDLLTVASSSGFVRLLTDPFPAGSGTYFRPLVMGTLAIEHALSAGPLLHHLINLVVHLANGLLVFAIGRALSRGKTSATPFLAALVFLVHPIVAYDANWISGRTDSFACFFSLVCLMGSSLGLMRTFGTFPSHLLAPLALLLALASKEVALSTPIAAIALHLFVTHDDPIRRLRARTTLFALVAIAVAWTALLVSRFYSTPEARQQVTALDPRSLLKGIASAPLLFLWPNSFWEVRHLLLTYPVLLPLSLLLIILAAGVAVRWLCRHRDRRDAVLALAVFAIAPLLPLWVASLVPTTRLMYLPLAATCIAAVGARQLVDAPLSPALRPITVAAIALMIVGSLLRGHRWIDNSRRLAGYCDDFIALRRDAPPNTTPLFVTFPFELDDTPLFVHHTHATLRACSSTAVDETMIVVGPVVMARPPTAPIVHARRAAHDPQRLELEITGASAFFGFEVPLESRSPVHFPEVTLIVERANNPREARALSAVFPPERLGNADLLYFDGQHLRRVAAP